MRKQGRPLAIFLKAAKEKPCLFPRCQELAHAAFQTYHSMWRKEEKEGKQRRKENEWCQLSRCSKNLPYA